MSNEINGDPLIDMNMIERLIQDDCLESVEVYASMISSLPTLSAFSKCQYLLELAKCYFKKSEFKHAKNKLVLAYYTFDEQNLELFNRDKYFKHNLEVQYYKVKCQMEDAYDKSDVEMLLQCIGELERIPESYYGYKHNYLLATLYFHTYHPEISKRYCFQALSKQPFSIECLTLLSSLGVHYEDIQSFYHQININIDSSLLLSQLIPGLVKEQTNTSESIQCYRQLSHQLSTNSYVLAMLCKCSLLICSYQEAILWYKRCLRSDSLMIYDIEYYIEAVLNHKGKDYKQCLHDIVLQLQYSNKNSFPFYFGLFCYYIHDELAKAKSYYQYCCSLNPFHFSVFKGKQLLLLKENHKEKLVQIAWDHVRQSPCLYAYKNLIECLIYAENIQHALYIAKNLYDSRAKKKDDASYTHELSECLYIYGKTLSQCVNGITNAKKQLEKALKYDKKNEQVLIALIRLYIGDNQLEKAKSLLLYLLPYHPSLFIQNLLIDILSRHEDYEETLYYLQTALKDLYDEENASEGISQSTESLNRLL